MVQYPLLLKSTLFLLERPEEQDDPNYSTRTKLALNCPRNKWGPMTSIKPRERNLLNRWCCGTFVGTLTRQWPRLVPPITAVPASHSNWGKVTALGRKVLLPARARSCVPRNFATYRIGKRGWTNKQKDGPIEMGRKNHQRMEFLVNMVWSW